MKIHKIKNILLLILVLLAGISVLSVGCGKPGYETRAAEAVDERETLYTCGMHPEVIQEGPGQCPICGMNLTPVEAGVNDVDGMMPNSVWVDPAMIQNIGVRYAPVEAGPVERTIRAAAHVDFDEGKYAVLSTRTDGWMERLHVASPGTEVSEGDPLFDFYAPTIYSAQEEYRIARRMGDTLLANAARERLRLLGVSDEMIEDIRINGSRHAITITSPMDGVVVGIGSPGASAASGSGSSGAGDMAGMGGMNDTNSGMGGSAGGEIREGDYVGSGRAVFSIADLASVWVYAHLYEDEVGYVETGMRAELELDYLPGEVIEGTVDFIYPYIDRQTRDIKIRISIENPDGKLMPGMFGTVGIQSTAAENGLLIPEEAVIHSGNRRVVFIAQPEGRFTPQEIVTGLRADDDMLQVLDGLEAGQSVVTSAQFLLDSESRLREAMNKMLSGPVNEEEPVTPAAEAEWVDLAPDDPDALFRCQMEECRYYTSEDGECPVCGMFLEPHDPGASSGDSHDH